MIINTLIWIHKLSLNVMVRFELFLYQLRGNNMESWQKLMKAGNEHYNQKQWNKAISLYNQSITLIEEQSYFQNDNLQQGIQAWICGYHNLASTYEQLGLVELSRDALVTPFNKMLSLNHSSPTSSDMQLVSCRALQMTLYPLLEFAKKHPSEFQFINTVLNHLNHSQPLH